MKKHIAIVLIITVLFSLFMIGCSGKGEEEIISEASTPTATPEPTPTPVVYDKTVGFDVILKDNAGNAISGGKITVKIGNDEFTGTADANGTASIAGLPVLNRMRASIADASGTEKASFLISIWDGYGLSCYSNKDLVSIDMPEGTQKIYAVLSVTEEGHAKCEYVSDVEFESTQDPTVDPGMHTDGENTTGDEPAQTLGTKYINSDGVNVRSEASTNGEVVAKLDLGTQVSITDNGTKDGDHTWFAISFKVNGEDKTGFIRDDLISDAMKVAKDGVNMRSSGSTSGDKVTSLSKGMVVYLLGDKKQDGDHVWYKVRCKSGGSVYTGYIRDDLLENA